eukprot:1389858-Amphidinium_carterae.1
MALRPEALKRSNCYGVQWLCHSPRNWEGKDPMAHKPGDLCLRMKLGMRISQHDAIDLRR